MAVLRAVLAILWLVFTSARAADAEGWKAGTASAVITPQRPMWMAGYAGRTQPAEGKLHDLWIKVLALEDSSGHRGVVLTSDLLGIPRPLYDEVVRQVEQRFGIGPAGVLLTSSHTHCGPVLQAALYDAYPLDDAQLRLIDEYSAWLERTIVETIGQALARLGPAQLSAGEGIARFAVNRRENREADVPQLQQAGVIKGPFDHAVPVLAVHHGERLGTIVFGYACHNTTLSFQLWCGDYAGFAQLALAERHPGLVAMFYMGCGADQNPLPRRTVERCQQYGTMLADAVDDVLRRPMTPLAPRLQTTFELVSLDLGPAPTALELRAETEKPDLAGRYARRLLRQIEEGQPLARTYSYPVQVWKLGDQLWISLGGEVVVDYALRLKQELGQGVWVTGYANDVMAYIPSLRVLREGGYEGASSMRVYGLPAHRWADTVEERIIAAVHRLVTQAKAPPAP